MRAFLLLFFLDFCKAQYSGDYFDNYEIQDDDKEILEVIKRLHLVIDVKTGRSR